jgi:hypothetical protein
VVWRRSRLFPERQHQQYPHQQFQPHQQQLLQQPEYRWVLRAEWRRDAALCQRYWADGDFPEYAGARALGSGEHGKDHTERGARLVQREYQQAGRVSDAQQHAWIESGFTSRKAACWSYIAADREPNDSAGGRIKASGLAELRRSEYFGAICKPRTRRTIERRKVHAAASWTLRASAAAGRGIFFRGQQCEIWKTVCILAHDAIGAASVHGQCGSANDDGAQYDAEYFFGLAFIFEPILRAR